MQREPISSATPALETAAPGQPWAIQADGLRRRFGNVTALAGVSLAVSRGEFFSLLGPSGCGKTTLLRIIAGLEHPDAGTLQIEGHDALCLPAHRRPVNTVFQSFALFPHLDVRGNIAFGLRMKKVGAQETAERVQRVMRLVELESLAGRKPAQLSGGQKQRVALARALVNEPRVLLLDEPLGALDLNLRQQLQQELHRLQRRTGITFVYVTHDQDEALSLSDRIAVMNAGRLEQVGTGQQLYERPRNRFVARFLGGCNLIEGATLPAAGGPDAAPQARTALGDLCLDAATVPPPTSAAVTLAIRPERITLHLPDRALPASNVVSAVVQEIRYAGVATHYSLEAAGQQLKVSTPNASGQDRFGVGQAVVAHLPKESLIPLED